MNTAKTLLHTLVLLLGLLSLTVQAGVEITYIHNDALGSSVAGTDEQGNVKWRSQYQPYGEERLGERSLFGVRSGYTGHREDVESGLVYMGARYYSPVTGRFMAVDPVGVDENNIHSFNRYAYANNNPYKFIDPDGRNAALAACAAGPVGCGFGIAITIYAGYQGIKGTYDALQNKNAGDEEAKDTTDKPTRDKKRKYTKKDRQKLYDSAGGTCEYCGDEITMEPGSGKSMEGDHIKPWADGGPTTEDNGAAACRDCN